MWEHESPNTSCMSKDFIEMYFHLPFGDLVFEGWSEPEEVLDGRELVGIARCLGISIEPAQLVAEMEARPLGSGDVFFYHSPTLPGAFLMIDYFKDPTDQCGMVRLGVRCPIEAEKEVFPLLQTLHRKGSGPRTPLCLDWFNEVLLRAARDSDSHN